MTGHKTLVEAMRGVVVERPGDARLTSLPAPTPGPGEALVRVHAVGICGSDLELLDGARPAPYVRYPIVPGHEWAGTIAAVGPDVTGLVVGDPVVAEGIRPCGTCPRCREGRTNLCESDYAETGFTHPGAFAEYVLVPARLVHLLPPGSNLQAASLLEPAACVANGLLAARLRPGLAIAVVGAGTLGLLAVALASLSSPARLALVGTRRERLELGHTLGARETIDARESDPVASLGDSFDLVFEAATRPDGARTALALAARGGSVVLEGLTGDPTPNLSSDDVAFKNLTVHGIFGASSNAWQHVVELFAAGLLDTRPLITHRFRLEEHEQAFATLRDRDAGALKVLLVP